MAVTGTQNQLNAALRYAGTATGTVFTLMAAMSLLSQDQVVALKANVETLKTSIVTGYGALMNMWIVLGPVAIAMLAKMGWDSSSIQAMGAKLLHIATSHSSPESGEAQTTIVAATSAIAQDKSAPKSTEATNALVAATIALPEVQTIVTDKATALASPSPSVIASTNAS